MTLSALITSCTKDITKYNENPKLPTEVPAAMLVTNAEKNLADNLTAIDGQRFFRLWSQHWTQATYIDESNYLIVGRDPSNRYWINYYSNVLNDLKSATEVINSDNLLDADIKRNQLAIIETINVYTYQQLVDMNGNVPYTEALDIENIFPKYDDAKTIYLDLIERINKAQEDLSEGGKSFGPADIFYKGDVAQWRKLANSVKLKLGMRLADEDAALAKTVVSEAYADGVLTSNADNAIIRYESSPTTNNNPVYNQFENQNRREDYIAGKTSVDLLTSLNDPRIGKFFADNKTPYEGGIIGANNAYANFTHINPSLVKDPTATGSIMDYAEVCFFLAEAATPERGFITGSPETFYNNGIKASIIQYGGTVEEADAYIAQASVAYSTATGDYKQKIGTQKWIALFNRGFEAWTEYRRLDWPELVAPAQSGLSIAIPKRVIYPVSEPNINGDNYDAASAAIGGDKLETPLFWDKF